MRTKKLQHDMRLMQLSTEKWITVREAARRLGMSQEGVRYNYDLLEATKVGSRQVVLASKVEFLRKCRAGLIDPPRPPEKTAPPPEVWKSERTGIEITGDAWADWDTGEIWVPKDQAAAVLGLTSKRIVQMGNEGKLRRRWSDLDGNEVLNPQSEIRNPKSRLRPMFCLGDVDALAQSRLERKSARGPRWNDPERTWTNPVYREFDDIDPNDQFITLAEAAAILGITRQSVASRIRRGRLFAWQKQPGRSGSPVYLSLLQIMRYKSDPILLKFRETRRAAEERKRSGEPKPKRYNEFREDNDLTVDMGHSLKTNHGEYYSTRQAAAVLGVTTGVVLSKRERGILKGYRRGHNAEQKFNLKRHWFFKKDDVESLKHSRDHKKRRAAYWLGRRRQMFGADVDSPTSTDPAIGPISPIRPTDPSTQRPKRTQRRKRPEHTPQWVKDALRGPVTPGEDHYIPHDPRNAIYLKTEHQRWLEETRAYLEELNTPDPRERGGEIPGRYFFPGHQLPATRASEDDDS